MLLASVTSTALLGIAAPAMADSLTPASCPGGICAGFSGTIGVGGSTSITNKVGVITAGTPTTAQADVLFITDTTGSMGPAISQINSTFTSVVSNLAGLGNVATGSAQYKDRTSDSYDPFDYHLNQAVTTNSSLTQAALGAQTASGGGDDPEQGLNALTQAATQASTGWRAGSKRIAVIVGDAPSHSSAGGHGPAANGVTVGSTAAALVANGVTVESLNASNLTGDSGLNGFGQFSGAGSIYAAGAAGSYTSSMPTGSALTAALTALIGSAFNSYSDVSLDLLSMTGSGSCSVSLPSDITGSFTRATTNTFDFGAVGITGLSKGTCDFTIALEADGAILATESDAVNIAAAPEPGTLAILGTGILALGAVFRRRRSA
jgi:hypothetical protein